MKYLLIILLSLSTFLSNGQSPQALFFALNSRVSVPAISSPMDIANISAYFHAGAGVSGTASVSSWADQSGNGYTLTPPSGKAPSLTTSAINGYPAISFNGSQRLINASFTLAQPYTIIVVGKVNSTDADAAVFFDSYNNSQAVLYRGTSGDLPNQFVFKAGGSAVQQKTANSNFNLHLVATSSTLDLYRFNGETQDYANKAWGTNGISGLSIGDIRGNPNAVVGGYALDGVVAEIVIYSRALTATDLQQLQTYYKNKYNLF